MKLTFGKFSLELTWAEILAGIALYLAPSPIKSKLEKQGEKMNKEFNDWVQVVVEVANDYKAAKADGSISVADSLLFVPALLKLPAAIDGSSLAFKDLNAEDVKSAAIAILSASGQNDGKFAIYVEEGFNIVSHGVEIFNSIKKIQAA